jgi:hypothetical protein
MLSCSRSLSVGMLSVAIPVSSGPVNPGLCVLCLQESVLCDCRRFRLVKFNMIHRHSASCRVRRASSFVVVLLRHLQPLPNTQCLLLCCLPRHMLSPRRWSSSFVAALFYFSPSLPGVPAAQSTLQYLGTLDRPAVARALLPHLNASWLIAAAIDLNLAGLSLGCAYRVEYQVLLAAILCVSGVYLSRCRLEVCRICMSVFIFPRTCILDISLRS